MTFKWEPRGGEDGGGCSSGGSGLSSAESGAFSPGMSSCAPVELNGYNLEIDPARIAALLEWAETRLPGAIDRERATPWAGLRPSMPGGVPIIGRSRHYENLWLNTGHGTLGWTLACGSASALAALMRGEKPTVEFPFI